VLLFTRPAQYSQIISGRALTVNTHVRIVPRRAGCRAIRLGAKRDSQDRWLGHAAVKSSAVEYIVKGLASGALRPVIDRTFKFDEMVDAHRYLETNEQFGKIVVTV
jgi:NADPH:quinone reductase-like Zn-dependent oxidoreductase